MTVSEEGSLNLSCVISRFAVIQIKILKVDFEARKNLTQKTVMGNGLSIARCCPLFCNQYDVAHHITRNCASSNQTEEV